MGDVKCPRPYYFEQGVIVFFVRNKEIHYNVLMWIDNGSKQISVDSGKYDGDYLDIKERALQLFSSVGRS